jgi:hypothetical protein
MSDLFWGYEVRQPYKSELKYFSDNPHVSGMATEDGRIIINPNSKLSDEQLYSVKANEAARLFLRERKIEPDFDITPEQRRAFKNTPYSNDDLSLKHTILGRLISGDTSAGTPTSQQIQWTDWLRQQLMSREIMKNRK